MRRVPTLTFDELYHVGSMDPAHKGDSSFEGAGLSVSLHPDEWRRIGRGVVGGDLWRLTKPGNKFVAAHDVDTGAVMEWAASNGYVTEADTWRVWMDSEEEERDSYFVFDKEEDARRELDDDTPEDYLESVRGFLATDKLRKAVGRLRIDPVMVPDLTLTVFAEENGFDGVWWEDDLDVRQLSAPRGVISPRRLGEWTIERIEDMVS